MSSPGGTPAEGAPRRASCPTARVYLPNRDGHSAWVNSTALEIAGVTTRHARPGRRADRARRRRRALGHAARGRRGPRRRARARRPRPRRWTQGLRKGQAYLHSLGITAWQDAIVDDRSVGRQLRRVRRGRRATATSPRGWSARCGGTAIAGLEQIDDLVALRERGRVGRFARHERQDHAGRRLRELHRRGARALPRRATGSPTDNRGISFVDPELLKGHVTELDALGSRCTSTPSPSGPCARRSTRSRRRSCANGPSDNRHHLAHIQVVHPDDIPRFRDARRGRERAAAVGRPRVADGRAHDPVPRRAALAVAVSVRAACVRAGADARDGQRLERLQPRSARGDARRREPHDAAGLPLQGRAPTRSSCPTSGSTCRRRSPAFTMGSAYVNHLDDADRLDRGRQARRPGGDRPRTCSSIRRTRSPTPPCSRRTWKGERVYAAPDADGGDARRKQRCNGHAGADDRRRRRDGGALSDRAAGGCPQRAAAGGSVPMPRRRPPNSATRSRSRSASARTARERHWHDPHLGQRDAALLEGAGHQRCGQISGCDARAANLRGPMTCSGSERRTRQRVGLPGRDLRV